MSAAPSLVEPLDGAPAGRPAEAPLGAPMPRDTPPPSPIAEPVRLVVMGVSAAGKSTVGRALAALLHSGYRDADDLHAAASIAKMSAGLPLTDEDRLPWLTRVGAELAQAERADASLVVACSALRRSYRDALRAQAPSTRFVHLTASRSVLAARVAARTGHFMPASLLDTQLEVLEPLHDDESGVAVDVEPPVLDIVTSVVAELQRALA